MAIGTSAAMDIYMRAWERLPQMFRIPQMPPPTTPDPSGKPLKQNTMVTEQLQKVYMDCYAPFDLYPVFCCAPLQRKSYDSIPCHNARRPGGEDWELLRKEAGEGLAAARANADATLARRFVRNSSQTEWPLNPARMFWPPFSLTRTFRTRIKCPPDAALLRIRAQHKLSEEAKLAALHAGVPSRAALMPWARRSYR